MSVTFADVGREVVGSVATEAPFLLAAKWAAERYRQMASRVRFRHARRLGDLVIPGTIDDGTISITRGSIAITGDATAQAAWLAAGDLRGRYLRASVVWHRIIGMLGNQLILSHPWTETDITTGSYKIVARFVQLPPQVKWLGETFVHVRMRNPLKKSSMAELEMYAPSRILASSPPSHWAETEHGFDKDGNRVRQIEFYPPPDLDELVRYPYWEEPELFSPNAQLPLGIESYVLKEGALIDLFRWEASRAMRSANVEAAGYWRNESRAQTTSWERTILEAIRNDRGSDDIMFILNTLGPSTDHKGDIITARDEIYSRGMRP